MRWYPIPPTNYLEFFLPAEAQTMNDESRAVAETAFQRQQRREREISEALKLEEERHAAMIKNMHRLRALRLSRTEAKTSEPK